jgi:hypothetical protein
VTAGKDGPINEEVKSDLAKVQSLARLSNARDKNRSGVIKMCRHCDKLETQMDSALLMKCQRCKIAYYCSKESQVADWKRHKRICNELHSGNNESRSTFKTSRKTTWAFIQSNYFNIAKEVYKKTQEYDVPKKELLVEIDFFGDAPALRNEFNVWLTSGFLQGSSVTDAPHWFLTEAEANKKTFTLQVKEQYARMGSDDFLVVYVPGNGMVTVEKF